MTNLTSMGARIFVSITLAAALASPLACGETERTVDCFQICSRYSECVTDIDVTSCTNECEDDADADADYESRADACEACIEDASCAEIDSCWDGCPVVPVAD